MEVRSIEAIVRSLNDAGVRYLIAGGLAVIAHGYTRVTQDVDLILDPAIRAQWIQEQRRTVLSLHSPAQPTVVVNLFVESPLDFAAAYPVAPRMELVPNLATVFVSYQDLLRLKRQAGRPKDLLDVEKLQALHGEGTDA